jgi:hypothetical protein
LLRHCPQLRMIAAKFACCYCHGTDCGGCQKNGNLMSLSLPDFSKETVVAFLELIYTGRTFFQVSIVTVLISGEILASLSIIVDSLSSFSLLYCSILAKKKKRIKKTKKNTNYIEVHLSQFLNSILFSE